MDVAPVDDMICAILRGEDVIWSSTPGNDLEEMFARRSEYHGVMALLNDHLPRFSDWPSSICEAVRRRAISQAFWELRHQRILGELVAALGTRGIEPVLFKGTAMAYGLYANPIWRARADTDVIVAPGDAGRTGEVLASLGFRRDWGVSGDFVTYQDSYIKDGQGGGTHAIDVHRRINNSELLSRLFSYAELRAEACPLPALCSGALAAGSVHALLLACLHRATHNHCPYYVDGTAYYSGDRLIWLYDIHLLAETFTIAQWQEFMRQATEKGLCATSLEGLSGAAKCFDTRYPDFVREALVGTGEPVAIYLNANRLRQSWIDFVAIPGVADRLQFARELVFPPKAYMHAKYAASRSTWLPWLYARRAFEGLAKRLSTNR